LDEGKYELVLATVDRAGTASTSSRTVHLQKQTRFLAPLERLFERPFKLLDEEASRVMVAVQTWSLYTPDNHHSKLDGCVVPGVSGIDFNAVKRNERAAYHLLAGVLAMGARPQEIIDWV
jgi:hypothetical protein